MGLTNLIAPSLSLLELPRLRENKFAYWLTAFVSVAAVAYLWMNLNGLDPQSYRGLTQRIFSSMNSLWQCALAGGGGGIAAGQAQFIRVGLELESSNQRILN